jgi:hypothetical protein
MSAEGESTNGDLAATYRDRVGHGANDPDAAYSDWAETVAEADIQEPSKDLLLNFVSKDWVYANFNPEEVIEYKFRLESRKLLYEALHPAPDCLITGAWRAHINDDPDDTLGPLTQRQQVIVDGLFQGIYARMTRGREGFQQEMFKTQIHEERRQNADDTSAGGLRDRVFGGG